MLVASACWWLICLFCCFGLVCLVAWLVNCVLKCFVYMFVYCFVVVGYVCVD